MLATFIVAGICVSEDRRHYWKYAIWPVVAFTLVLGLRLNRGNDYIHYMQVYLYDLEDNQVLFTAFNHFLKVIGTGPHWIFIWYSGAFVLGGAWIIRDYRTEAKWLFPLFLMSFVVFSEFMIRQAFGAAFLFFMMYSLMNNKASRKQRIIGTLFWLCVSYTIHSANLIPGVIIIGLYLVVYKPIPWQFSIPAYIVASYILQKNFDFSYLSDFLSVLGNQNDKFSEYTTNSDKWFSADAMNEEWYRKPVVKVFETAGNIALLYLGYYQAALFKKRKYVTVYNLVVIGAIVEQSFFTIEILRRMGDAMYWFWCFPLASVLCYRQEILGHVKSAYKRMVVKGLYVLLAFFVYDYLKYLFLRPLDMYKFIWDM